MQIIRTVETIVLVGSVIVLVLFTLAIVTAVIMMLWWGIPAA